MRASESHSLPPLEACPALVLNADYRPLSYFPLSTWNWQETIKAIFLDRVLALSHYDRVVRSPSSVCGCRAWSRSRSTSRRTAARRSPGSTCSCATASAASIAATAAPASELTFDHLVPRSRGGTTSWSNVVTACTGCNLNKGNRLPQECGMRPLSKPRAPTTFELQKRGRPSRPITCTRAGATSSIGTPSWILEPRRRPSPIFLAIADA